MPDYLEAISAAYQAVQQGSSDPSAVLQALQYENWQNLPADLQAKIEQHEDYNKIDPAAEWPAAVAGNLVKGCNPNPSKRGRIDIEADEIFRLVRSREEIEPDMESWFLENKEQLFPTSASSDEQRCIWCSKEKLPCATDVELWECILTLGLSHYSGTNANTHVFYFAMGGAECVAPNALDAQLAGYFYQPPAGTESMTRHLGSDKLGVAECLALVPTSEEQFQPILELMQYIHAHKLKSRLTINFAAFIQAHAKRIK